MTLRPLDIRAALTEDLPPIDYVLPGLPLGATVRVWRHGWGVGGTAGDDGYGDASATVELVAKLAISVRQSGRCPEVSWVEEVRFEQAWVRDALADQVLLNGLEVLVRSNGRACSRYDGCEAT